MNPWEEISLSDYENHMSLDSVKQLQTMNEIMKAQFATYPVSTAMVLGVAGGNGLEYVSSKKYKKVYGIDINVVVCQKTNGIKTVDIQYLNFSAVVVKLCGNFG